MVVVFQLLPSAAGELEGAVELEGAAETQSSVKIKELMQFVEAEPLTLGVEEVRGPGDKLVIGGDMQDMSYG